MRPWRPPVIRMWRVACDMPLLTRVYCRRIGPAGERGVDWSSAIGGGAGALQRLRRETCLPWVERRCSRQHRWWVCSTGAGVILTPGEVAEFDPQQLAFINLNTPEELLQRSLVRQKPGEGGALVRAEALARVSIIKTFLISESLPNLI